MWVLMGQTLGGLSKKDLTRVLRSCFNIGCTGQSRECSSLLGVETAPFGRRLVALFADWTLSYFVAAFLVSMHLGSISVMQNVVFFIENILFISTTGASVGQRLMKLKVVSYPDGGYITFGRAFVRTLLLSLVLPALFTKQRRGWHDIAANSLIVNA